MGFRLKTGGWLKLGEMLVLETAGKWPSKTGERWRPLAHLKKIEPPSGQSSGQYQQATDWPLDHKSQFDHLFQVVSASAAFCHWATVTSEPEGVARMLKEMMSFWWLQLQKCLITTG